jgi:hypothetical protein
MTLLPLSLRRIAALAALLAAVGSAAPAGGASAASISTPEVIRPGAKIPIDFPGYREPTGDRLPAGYRIVRRTARLVRGEQMIAVMSAPRRFRIVTFGTAEGGEVGFAATDPDYRGQRTTRVRLFAVDRLLERGQTGTATIYLLARRAR